MTYFIYSKYQGKFITNLVLHKVSEKLKPGGDLISKRKSMKFDINQLRTDLSEGPLFESQDVLYGHNSDAKQLSGISVEFLPCVLTNFS